MSLTQSRIKEIARDTASLALFSYFSKNKIIRTKHLLLSKVFPEQSATSSLMQGLATSLGIKLWQELAEKIALVNNFTLLAASTLRQPKPIPKNLINFVAQWKDKRLNNPTPVPMSTYVQALKGAVKSIPRPQNFSDLQKGSGCDLFIEKNGIEYAFDIKTVQINAGGGPKFNETLMNWHAYRYLDTGSNRKFFAHIAIPYNPYPSDQEWWQAFGGRVSPLDRDDLLLGDKFWDLLSGTTGTLAVITEAFNNCSSHWQKIYLPFFANHSAGQTQLHLRIEMLKRLPNNSQITGRSRSVDLICKKCETKVTFSLNRLIDALKNDSITCTCSNVLISLK